ncbi:MAG: galactokinase [Ruminococcaceae bacterium]|nr:galactokinase [Oscillospiraceae bacterium]
MNIAKCIEEIQSQKITKLFEELYGTQNNIVEKQRQRYTQAIKTFCELFPEREEIKIYSAPGRTEIGGNHTDHQHGKILAGAVNLDIIAIVSFHNEGVIRVKSEGYELAEIELKNIVPDKNDDGTKALVKGVVSKFQEKNITVDGFDMYTISDVIRGGGISSSAAFETLIGTVIDEQYNGGKSTPFEIAQYGWYAENVFFGKSCGLLDQTVCSYGGLVCADFKNPNAPEVKKLDFDFEKFGYTLCITDTKSSHENLTGDYIAIREEMKQVAACFGCEVLSQVDEKELYSSLPTLRKSCSDRALLRAMHFLSETKRAFEEAEALKNNDIELFLKLVNESGISSGNLLQNLYSTNTPTEQAIPLALVISKRLLKGAGAFRVHGGGFAGTIQAFVPTELVSEYKAHIEEIFGKDSCLVMKIRPVGGIEIMG